MAQQFSNYVFMANFHPASPIPLPLQLFICTKLYHCSVYTYTKPNLMLKYYDLHCFRVSSVKSSDGFSDDEEEQGRCYSGSLYYEGAALQWWTHDFPLDQSS